MYVITAFSFRKITQMFHFIYETNCSMRICFQTLQCLFSFTYNVDNQFLKLEKEIWTKRLRQKMPVLKYSAILGMYYLPKTPHRVKDRCFFSNPPSHPQSRLTSTRARVFTIVWHLELKFSLESK